MPPAPEAQPRHAAAAAFAQFFHLTEVQLQADKARREASRQAAFARGLDAAERAARRHTAAGLFRRASSERRMDPLRHARNLLLETTLPLREIVRLTGLSVWQVVGLKLKLRVDAVRRRN